MPYVRFSRAFDWNPPERHGMTTLAYEAGKIYSVRTECARAAVAAGAATRTTRPKEPRDGEGDQRSG